MLGSNAVMGSDETFRSGAPRFWWDNWAIPSWISLVGDADGDGRADLVAVEPRGRSKSRNLALGKWANDPDRNNRFGNDLVAAVVGRFTGGEAIRWLRWGATVRCLWPLA